jgi:structural maintenance of chromosome 4
MFELADRLVGIYKTNDATKSVTINPRTFNDSTSGKLESIPKTSILGDKTNCLA